MQPERRKSLRVPDSRTISVVAGGATFDAHLTNLSTLGALVEGKAVGVAPGMAVQLKFPVAAGGKLVATGRVVRVGVPAGTIAFAFDRPLQEFPVEQGPGMTAAAPIEIPTAGANPVARGCAMAIGGLAILFALGAVFLALKS